MNVKMQPVLSTTVDALGYPTTGDDHIVYFCPQEQPESTKKGRRLAAPEKAPMQTCARPHYWCLWFGRGPHRTLRTYLTVDTLICQSQLLLITLTIAAISFRCAAAGAPALFILAPLARRHKKGTRPSFTSLCAPLLLFLQDESECAGPLSFKKTVGDYVLVRSAGDSNEHFTRHSSG